MSNIIINSSEGSIPNLHADGITNPLSSTEQKCERVYQAEKTPLLPSPKPNKPGILSRILDFFLSILYGILKLFGCQPWNAYLRENTDSIQGDPDEAEVIFIGDCHLDQGQDAIRTKLINHYGNESKNLIFVETVESGKRVKPTMKNLPFEKIEKPSQIYGWDNQADWEESGNLYSQLSKNSTSEEVARVSNRVETLKRERDQSLIKTVQDKPVLTDRKIFVVAGSRHIQDPETGYSVLDAFPGRKCAVIMPKKSVESASVDEMLRYVKED